MLHPGCTDEFLSWQFSSAGQQCPLPLGVGSILGFVLEWSFQARSRKLSFLALQVNIKPPPLTQAAIVIQLLCVAQFPGFPGQQRSRPPLKRQQWSHSRSIAPSSLLCHTLS